MKECTKCKVTKAVDNFYLRADTGKYRSECAECRNSYNLNLYHTNERQKENHSRAARKSALMQKYDLTVEAYSELVHQCDNKCMICGNETPDKNLFVDHCHTTGEVRGLLCNFCNTGLGMFRDSKQLLQLAMDYLGETEDGFDI